MSIDDTLSSEEMEEPEVREVTDVEDMKQRKRLEALLESEQRAREVRMKAKATGSDVGVTAYRAAVEDYIGRLREAMKKHDPELWTEKRLGSVTLQPPSAEEFFSDLPDQELTDLGTPRFGKAVGVDRLEARTVYEFEGLQSVFDAPPSFAESWTIYHEPAGGGRSPVEEPKETDIPMPILDEAFEEATSFADRQGLGLNTEDEGAEATADYSDVLE